MKSEQQAFLADVIFNIALTGTVQRGKLYREGSTEIQKRAFRSALRNALENLVDRYGNGVSEEEHIANIDALADTLSKRYPDSLKDGRFRIGSAQKALNLYLKFLWCLDRIPMPPHCPFDAIVLSCVQGCEAVRWTRLDDLSEYRRIVDCAKVAARGAPLAEWELCVYSAAQSARRSGKIA
ncbi:MAG: hypothetical protein H7Z16_13990 [Pyrinomonadaceae bacterium]|nr:hypothetical protein [Pyrinomonadaceae bacterium]